MVYSQKVSDPAANKADGFGSYLGRSSCIRRWRAISSRMHGSESFTSTSTSFSRPHSATWRRTSLSGSLTKTSRSSSRPMLATTSHTHVFRLLTSLSRSAGRFSHGPANSKVSPSSSKPASSSSSSLSIICLSITR